MDPNKAWADLAEAVEANHWDTATEIANNLGVWMARGGFPPVITGLRTFDTIVARHTAQAIATWELA